MKTVWGLLGTLALTSAAHAVPVVIAVSGCGFTLAAPFIALEVAITKQNRTENQS